MKPANMIHSAFKWLGNALADIYTTTIGLMAACFGYLLPLRDMMHFIIALFAVEMIVGYLVAKKVRGDHFRLSVVFTKTVPRLGLVIFMIIGTFMWDDVHNQDTVHTYTILSWFIGGILLASISRKGYILTGWSPFKEVSKFIKAQGINKLQK